MQEVKMTLRFNQPCLGHIRAKRYNTMHRDPEGRVMFMTSWWQSIATYAAQLANVPVSLVKKIDWSPVVEGETTEYRRFYGPNLFSIHEAFLPGDSISVTCVLPNGLALETFKEIMGLAGKYKGIAPYRNEKKQGTFDVLEISPLRAATLASGDNQV